MQIVCVTDIDGHRQPRVRVLCDSLPLSLAKFRPIGLPRRRRELAVIRELHNEEWKRGAKLMPPIGHQASEQRLVFARFARIRLTLVPQRSAQGIPAQGRDHGVVQRRQTTHRLPRRARRIANRRQRDAVLPRAIQRNRFAIRQLQGSPGATRQQAPSSVVTEDIDHQNVVTGM
jgi:hypothetical protein